MEEFSVHSLNYEPGKFTGEYLSVSGQFICQLYLQASKRQDKVLVYSFLYNCVDGMQN